MTNQRLKLHRIAILVVLGLAAVACSSSSNTGGGTGGSGGSTGGGTGGTTGADAGVTHMVYPAFPGSCVDGMTNPDFQTGGACAPECQSVGCGTACTQDCCVNCGIDQAGIKFCNCRTPGLPYANCNCAAPPDIPPGLMGGPCVPAGDSRPLVQAATSLRGMPCKMKNLVCFTTDNMSSSERGCICKQDSDGDGGTTLTMHCGSVNKWFTNNAVPTEWMP